MTDSCGVARLSSRRPVRPAVGAAGTADSLLDGASRGPEEAAGAALPCALAPAPRLTYWPGREKNRYSAEYAQGFQPLSCQGLTTLTMVLPG